MRNLGAFQPGTEPLWKSGATTKTINHRSLARVFKIHDLGPTTGPAPCLAAPRRPAWRSEYAREFGTPSLRALHRAGLIRNLQIPCCPANHRCFLNTRLSEAWRSPGRDERGEQVADSNVFNDLPVAGPICGHASTAGGNLAQRCEEVSWVQDFG